VEGTPALARSSHTQEGRKHTLGIAVAPVLATPVAGVVERQGVPNLAGYLPRSHNRHCRGWD
jgi:hypothetical protein